MKACTASQMREIDRRAVDEYGMPSLLLMENAGRAVAERALALLAGKSAPVVWVACGKGNNGGDGFVAARHLFNRGIEVSCTLAGKPEDMQGDARVNLDLARKLGIDVFEWDDQISGLPSFALFSDLVVDALLGTGFSGEPRGPVAELIAAIHEGSARVLAIDVPSGLNADTDRRATSACARMRRSPSASPSWVSCRSPAAASPGS
jgi:ADP-dependent NAD(P)H-hydrate dehydratase / NAD(P)H-hydrate epimerase